MIAAPALVLALFFGSVAVPSLTPAVGAISTQEVLAHQLLEDLNAERSARGLPNLVVNSSLEQSSQRWSDAMASRGRLEHSSDGRAEIIARGWWTGQISVAWMESSSHRNLVVDPNLGTAGVGVACGPNGQIWATVQFFRNDTSFGTQQSSNAQPVVTNQLVGSDCGDTALVNQVRRLYHAYFRRESDGAGLAYWVEALSNGHRLSIVSEAFAGSNEFRYLYGGLTDERFIGLVYRNVLGRSPDAAGLRYWTGQLDAGVRWGDVMTAFSESSEFRARTRIN